jgi:hypothetical protein
MTNKNCYVFLTKQSSSKKRFSSVVHLSVKVKKVNHKKSIFSASFYLLCEPTIYHTLDIFDNLYPPPFPSPQKSKRIRDGKLRNQIVFFVTHIIFILMLRYLRKVPFDSTENKEDENCPNFTCSNKKISEKKSEKHQMVKFSLKFHISQLFVIKDVCTSPFKEMYFKIAYTNVIVQSKSVVLNPNFSTTRIFDRKISTTHY